MDKIKTIFQNNKNIFLNILSAYGIKGFSVLLSLFSVPAYMRFFQDQNVLGVWYTILSLIEWVFMFDFGIGHGLRNKLVEAFVKKDTQLAKGYISSAYVGVSIIVGIFIVFATLAISFVDWNAFLNISPDRISHSTLQKTMLIVCIGIILEFELKLINSVLYAMQKSALNNFLCLLSNFLIYLYLLFGNTYSDGNNLLILSIVNVIATALPLFIANIVIYAKPLSEMRPSIHYAKKMYGKEVLGIGITLLWLQIMWMITAYMHQFFISKLVSPEAVVQYQIYYKIFNIVASIAILALIPIWSAVTKALVEKRYDWIQKTYRILMLFTAAVIFGCFLITPFLQSAVNVWLKNEAISIETEKVICMILYCGIFVLHNVNTSISNGMSWFRVQSIWMTVAAICMIPLSVLLCKISGSWSGVVWASTISLLPYEIIQPCLFHQYIERRSECNGKQ